MELEDKVAVVTGAGRGVGRGIAVILATRGAKVLSADIDEAAALATAETAQNERAGASQVRVDVADRSSTDEMARVALESYGRVDILVNCAATGGAAGWWERDRSSAEDWEAAFAVNAWGVVHCVESLREHMTARGAGRVVNIASTAGRAGTNDVPHHYSASMAAAVNTGQALALQLARHNINVNSVCVDAVWTPLTERLSSRARRLAGSPEESPREFFERRVLAETPLGREQTAADVGKLVAFLCSERARNITGQTINLNGGALMS